jgi:diadenosine tetraphosphate (Ap4A) HIT family hydrolase/ribosomal protein S18 acetylase RimI-like enzyme
MLIRWATSADKPDWTVRANDVAEMFGAPDMPQSSLFREYMASKIDKYEALVAIDRMSGKCMGFIGFSRTKNRISWLGVSEQKRGRGIDSRLLKTALRHLDTNSEITVTTFRDDYAPGFPAKAVYRKFGFTDKEYIEHDGQPRVIMSRPPTAEKRGGSFHYHYPEFIRAAGREHCPVCNDEPMPDGQNDIEINDTIWVCGEYPGQGRLFGKLYVMPRVHAFHFEDMPPENVAAFMCEVQLVGRALRKVTGAVKINYEMHSNSGAHLHIHLFPRYLDDDFPSAPIDYRVAEPAAYESYEEYLWFIEKMREELRNV